MRFGESLPSRLEAHHHPFLEGHRDRRRQACFLEGQRDRRRQACFLEGHRDRRRQARIGGATRVRIWRYVAPTSSSSCWRVVDCHFWRVVGHCRVWRHVAKSVRVRAVVAVRGGGRPALAAMLSDKFNNQIILCLVSFVIVLQDSLMVLVAN